MSSHNIEQLKTTTFLNSTNLHHLYMMTKLRRVAMLYCLTTLCDNMWQELQPLVVTNMNEGPYRTGGLPRRGSATAK